ncbi:PLP-dependent cysteine synthase family protein [Azotobacter armeniacus]
MSRLIKCGNRLFAKLEMDNPGGSHKYRAASYIVDHAVASGHIIPNVTTVIEKTGGNFGFGLVAACQKYNVPVELAVGLSFSQAKRDLLECFGARLIGKQMMVEGATPKEIVLHHLEHQESLGRQYFYTDQFQNHLGIDAHRLTTGPELARQLIEQDAGKRILFVACAGTGASFTGVARGLQDAGFELSTIMVEPEGCDMQAGHFSDHRLEGMAVGVSPPFLDWSLVGDVRHVSLDAMLDTQRWLYLQSGFYIGNTSAATLAVARSLLKEPAYRGWSIVTLVYDSGLWYQDLLKDRL